jgi:hypothetical protein
MSTPESPTPRSGGSHRAAPESAGAAQEGTPLLLPVLSVLVVLGAIGLAAWMLLTADNGDEQADDQPVVTQPTPDASDTASAEPTDDDKGDGDKNNGGGDDDGDKDDGNKNDDKGDGDGDKNDKNDQQAQPVPQIPVYVFNQTSITGLAAETATGLESAGWNVVGVDNWIGRVPTDTVYYYPGDRAAAERLSKDFPDIGRVWPASAPMPAGALTVILADTARK